MRRRQFLATASQAAAGLALTSVNAYGTPSIPQRIDGIEFMSLKGWLAFVYHNWTFVKEWATIWPPEERWTPVHPNPDNTLPYLLPQSPFQVQLSSAQLKEYGSGTDIIQFSANPDLGDLVNWTQNYLNQLDTLRRPFFIALEHMNGTTLRPGTGLRGSKVGCFDMSSPYNRNIFTQNVDYTFRNVIVPYAKYYVTLNKRALIYLWATQGMCGDFGGLLEEIKLKYPVSFIGSEVRGPDRRDSAMMSRFAAMDGFMAYSLFDPENKGNYLNVTENYLQDANNLAKYLKTREVNKDGAKRPIFIPTYEMAADDRRYPGRQGPDGTPKNAPMYVGGPKEWNDFAEKITELTGTVFTGGIGPVVNYNEPFEGRAVIESQPQPSEPGKYPGFGRERLEKVQQHFGSR